MPGVGLTSSPQHAATDPFAGPRPPHQPAPLLLLTPGPAAQWPPESDPATDGGADSNDGVDGAGAAVSNGERLSSRAADAATIDAPTRRPSTSDSTGGMRAEVSQAALPAPARTAISRGDDAGDGGGDTAHEEAAATDGARVGGTPASRSSTTTSGNSAAKDECSIAPRPSITKCSHPGHVTPSTPNSAFSIATCHAPDAACTAARAPARKILCRATST